MTYGHEVKGPDDRFLDAAKKLSNLACRASLPGSLLVNELPFCTSVLRVFYAWRPFTGNAT